MIISTVVSKLVLGKLIPIPSPFENPCDAYDVDPVDGNMC